MGVAIQNVYVAMEMRGSRAGFEKCNFGHLSGLANCSSELRVPFLGDPHHKIYVVVVRRQVFKTATLAGGLFFLLKIEDLENSKSFRSKG